MGRLGIECNNFIVGLQICGRPWTVFSNAGTLCPRARSELPTPGGAPGNSPSPSSSSSSSDVCCLFRTDSRILYRAVATFEPTTHTGLWLDMASINLLAQGSNPYKGKVSNFKVSSPRLCERKKRRAWQPNQKMAAWLFFSPRDIIVLRINRGQVCQMSVWPTIATNHWRKRKSCTTLAN